MLFGRPWNDFATRRLALVKNLNRGGINWNVEPDGQPNGQPKPSPKTEPTVRVVLLAKPCAMV
jgi:hypothetical protein